MGKFGGFGGGGGFPGGGNMQQLLKQAQKMQADMQKAQEELKSLEIEADSGGGMVTVVVSGEKKLISIKIKPEAVDPDDVEMLEDMILAAYNEAYTAADAEYQKLMSPYGAGAGLL